MFRLITLGILFILVSESGLRPHPLGLMESLMPKPGFLKFHLLVSKRIAKIVFTMLDDGYYIWLLTGNGHIG